MTNILKSTRFYIPLVTGYLMTFFCPINKNTGVNIKARPPAFIFGIIWPILYLLIGYSWDILKNNKNTDIIFGVNTFLGIIWLYTYSCKKKERISLYILLVMLLVSVYLLFFSFKINSNITYLLIPYFTWLLFALMLNFKLVNK